MATETTPANPYPRSVLLRDCLLIASLAVNQFALLSVVGPLFSDEAKGYLPFLGIIFNWLALFALLLIWSRFDRRTGSGVSRMSR